MSKERSPLASVRLPIALAAVILILLPTGAAFYAVQGILNSGVAIGLNPAVDRELEASGERLRELARLDPSRVAARKAEFERLQEVRRGYGLLIDTQPAMDRSLTEVFAIIVGLSLGVAIALAWLLNRIIVRSYDLALAKMRSAEQRTAYLETRESWSVVAQKMVHEVKNPLTPVQVLVGRLRKRYAATAGTPAFDEVLSETERVVNEEIGRVNAWVEAFARYARLPEPVLGQLELVSFGDGALRGFAEYWEGVAFRWRGVRPARPVWVRTDERLLRQVLFNLAKNSVEAGAKSIEIELTPRGLAFGDDGPGISPDRASRIFQPFQTTKDAGRGLGLAICRRVLSELGGSIRLTPGAGTRFELDLPERIDHE